MIRTMSFWLGVWMLLCAAIPYLVPGTSPSWGIALFLAAVGSFHIWLAWRDTRVRVDR